MTCIVDPSALMAPILAAVTDGDMSPLDYPFGDVRPWPADRRLGEGVAMVSRPLHVLLCVQAQVRRHAPDGPYEGPDHLICLRCGKPKVLLLRLPAWQRSREMAFIPMLAREDMPPLQRSNGNE